MIYQINCSKFHCLFPCDKVYSPKIIQLLVHFCPTWLSKADASQTKSFIIHRLLLLYSNI